MTEPRVADDDTAFERCIAEAFRSLPPAYRACFAREEIEITSSDMPESVFGEERATGMMVSTHEIRLSRRHCEMVAGMRGGEFWAELVNVIRETLVSIITQHITDMGELIG